MNRAIIIIILRVLILFKSLGNSYIPSITQVSCSYNFSLFPLFSCFLLFFLMEFCTLCVRGAFTYS